MDLSGRRMHLAEEFCCSQIGEYLYSVTDNYIKDSRAIFGCLGEYCTAKYKIHVFLESFVAQ